MDEDELVAEAGQTLRDWMEAEEEGREEDMLNSAEYLVELFEQLKELEE